MTFTKLTVPAAGSYVLSLFYSNQDVSDRTATLTVNGVAGAPVSFASTGSFDTVGSLNVSVDLNAGDNTITIGNAKARAPSFDRMVVSIP